MAARLTPSPTPRHGRVEIDMHIDWSKAPEGATHYMPKREESEWWRAVFWALDTSGKPVTAWAVDDDGTLEQYARPTWSEKDRVRLIPRPTTPQWSGEGLPPVGAWCEYFDGGEWMRCEAVAHRNNAAVVLSDCYEAAFVPRHELRPIRTPEQIAAEERKKAVAEMAAAINSRPVVNLHEAALYALYDAGYRKIPDELAERVGQ